jgi:hypothetical protein
MRETRFAAAAAVHGDHLYILGGSNEGNTVLDSIERLDLRTGVAEEFARLKRARLWHRAIVVDDLLYVMGGEALLPNAQGEARLMPDDSVEIVDLRTRRISAGPAMPEARRSFGAVLWKGTIHVMGGCLRGGTGPVRTNTTVRLDLATQRWAPGAPMPTARETDAVLVEGPRFLIAGGFDGRDARAEVEWYDPRAGTWETLPPLCRSASAHSLAALGSQVYVFGHYDAPEQCLAYDLRTQRSQAVTPPYKGARHTAVMVHQEKIYVIGGRGSESPEAFDLIQVFARRPARQGAATPAKSR